MKYVALLRGIVPSNPNMANDKLRAAAETVGFHNVQSVISSGNLFIETDLDDIRRIESKLEAELRSSLGIGGCAIIRSQDEVETFLATKPFKKAEHSPPTYLTVTFLKNKLNEVPFDIPHHGQGFEMQKFDKDISALCCVTDTTSASSVDLMGWLERQLGKDITTRTIKTVERIAKKF